MLSLMVIKICWVVYFGFWIISARKVKASVERQNLAGILSSRLPFLPGAFLLFNRDWPHPLESAVLGSADFTRPVGAMVCLLGLAGAIWSRVTLADNWSAMVTFKKGHELVTRGPYRFARHPIYTSILLLLLGTAIAEGRLAALLAVPFFVAGFWIKLKQEESLLIGHFPVEYPAYRARVKALVPFLI